MIFKRTWKKVLSENEIIKHEFSIGKGYRIFGVFFWVIISSLVLFFPLNILIFLAALFYYGFYLKVANVYAFTNERVLIHRGWLSTTLVSIDYKKITDVTVDESIFGCYITHTGLLKINTAGTSLPEIVLTHVSRPYELKKILDGLKD